MGSKEFQRLIKKENLEQDCLRLMNKTTIQNKRVGEVSWDIIIKLAELNVFKNKVYSEDGFYGVYHSVLQILTND